MRRPRRNQFTLFQRQGNTHPKSAMPLIVVNQTFTVAVEELQVEISIVKLNSKQ